jgi:uncharacterized sulfatase
LEPDQVGKNNATSVFSAIDLVPTLLAIAGFPPREEGIFDGQSLPDVVLGRSSASRSAPLFFRRPPDRDAFYGIEDCPDLAVRDGNWKLLCEYDGSDAMLYNLESDRGETNNLIGEHPETAKRLTDAVVSWHQSMPQDKGATFQQGKKK